MEQFLLFLRRIRSQRQSLARIRYGSFYQPLRLMEVKKSHPHKDLIALRRKQGK